MLFGSSLKFYVMIKFLNFWRIFWFKDVFKHIFYEFTSDHIVVVMLLHLNQNFKSEVSPDRIINNRSWKQDNYIDSFKNKAKDYHDKT